MTGVDEHLQGRVRVGADVDVEDPRRVELEMLALGDDALLVQLPRISIEH
ncbi:hypothetical protein [Microbacterium sp. NPDC077486]